MTDHLQALGGPRTYINRECRFGRAARDEVTDIAAEVWNTNFAGEVALLADAVARFDRQLRRIQDGARHGFSQMGFYGTVATGAANSVAGKSG